MSLNLRIGVLVVGSLDWESKDHGGEMSARLQPIRVNWREARLKKDKRSVRFVRAPIRYGRKSNKRGNSYTMVFSPERNASPGIGKVITCRRSVTNIGDLVEEAEALWAAESAPKKVAGTISAGWGCVALVTSPNFLHGNDAEERAQLLEDWRLRTAKEVGYGQLGFSTADVEAAGGPPVIEHGRLKILWPKFKNHWSLSLDLILLTATNAERDPRKKYPTPEEIAHAWRNNEHVYYFRSNQLAGITTADDEDILRILGG